MSPKQASFNAAQDNKIVRINNRPLVLRCSFTIFSVIVPRVRFLRSQTDSIPSFFCDFQAREQSPPECNHATVDQSP